MSGPQATSLDWFDGTIEPMVQDPGEALAIRSVPTMPSGLENSVTGNGAADLGFTTTAITDEVKVIARVPWPPSATDGVSFSYDLVIYTPDRQDGLGVRIAGNGIGGSITLQTVTVTGGTKTVGIIAGQVPPTGSFEDAYVQFGVSSGLFRHNVQIDSAPPWPGYGVTEATIPVGLRYLVIEPSVGTPIFSLGHADITVDDGEPVILPTSGMAVVSGGDRVTFSSGSSVSASADLRVAAPHDLILTASGAPQAGYFWPSSTPFAGSRIALPAGTDPQGNPNTQYLNWELTTPDTPRQLWTGHMPVIDQGDTENGGTGGVC